MRSVSAQISLYPLRQESLSAVIDPLIEALVRSGLDVQPGTMSTVVAGDLDAVFAALRDVFRDASDRGETVMVVTLSNACPERRRG